MKISAAILVLGISSSDRPHGTDHAQSTAVFGWAAKGYRYQVLTGRFEQFPPACASLNAVSCQSTSWRLHSGVASSGLTRWVRSTAHTIYPSVPGRAHSTLRFSSSKKFSRKFTWTVVDPPLADSGARKTTKRLPSGAKSRGG